MGSIKTIVPSVNLSGMNTPTAWVDIAQGVNIDDPWASRTYPGAIIFGSEVAAKTFTQLSGFTNGDVLLEVSGLNLIKYVHNGAWLIPGRSETVMDNHPQPIFDLFLFADAALPIPLRIKSVLNATQMIVSDPQATIELLKGGAVKGWFTQELLYPNKQVIAEDPFGLTIYYIGGGTQPMLSNPTGTSYNFVLEQIEDETISFFGVADINSDTHVSVLK